MLFMSQVFLLPEILLIAEIIIIATRCLIRWEWQNFHRPYSRKNFRRLSSHKKRHKLTPHILLKTKIYEYSRIDTEAHTIFIYKIPFHFCHADQLNLDHRINGQRHCPYQRKYFTGVNCFRPRNTIIMFFDWQSPNYCSILIRTQRVYNQLINILTYKCKDPPHHDLRLQVNCTDRGRGLKALGG